MGVTSKSELGESSRRSYVYSACLPQQWLVKILSKRGALLDQVNRWLA